MTREGYIRLAGWVALVAAALIAVLIPVSYCLGLGGDLCGSTSLWRALTTDVRANFDYNWALRIGVLAVGVFLMLGLKAMNAPRDREGD
jgi:hypothetical protein